MTPSRSHHHVVYLPRAGATACPYHFSPGYLLTRMEGRRSLAQFQFTLSLTSFSNAFMTPLMLNRASSSSELMKDPGSTSGKHRAREQRSFLVHSHATLPSGSRQDPERMCCSCLPGASGCHIAPMPWPQAQDDRFRSANWMDDTAGCKVKASCSDSPKSVTMRPHQALPASTSG